MHLKSMFDIQSAKVKHNRVWDFKAVGRKGEGNTRDQETWAGRVAWARSHGTLTNKKARERCTRGLPTPTRHRPYQ